MPINRMLFLFILAIIVTIHQAAAARIDSRLIDGVVETEEAGTSIILQDFQRFQPSNAVVQIDESALKNGQGLNNVWQLGRPAGTPVLLKAQGKAVEITYDPRLKPPNDNATQQKAKLTPSKVTICQKPGRHFAFPGGIRANNGDLLVVCREGDGHVCPHGRIIMLRSTDAGKSWGAPQVIYDSISDDRGSALFKFKDGTIGVTFVTYNTWMPDPGLRKKYPRQTAMMDALKDQSFKGNWLMLSKDNGMTWGQPTRTPVYNPHGPTVGIDGSLYYIGPEQKQDRQDISIYRSRDHGRSWQHHVMVVTTPPMSRRFKEVVLSEPNLAILPDGEWIVSMRANFDGYVRQSRSNDQGRTWTSPAKLNVRGYPQHLLPLSDGRLLMTYGYRYRPFGIRACVSNDRGKSWALENEIILENDGTNHDLGYPASIELCHREVFTVYYHRPGTDCIVKGSFYKP